MVVLAQGPGPFVSRRDVIESTISEIEAVKIVAIFQVNINNYNQQGHRLIEWFYFSSSLFLNFSEEKLLSLEGPPAAEALFVTSAWIQ